MPHKLLLADDSVTIQRVIELTFADEDVQVIAVGDGRQAIDRVQTERPDIVLADIGMPERDGYEVASFIRSTPSLAHIPVLLLTGAFEPIDEGRARAAGCDGVLVKPFEPQMVISRVKDLIAGRRPAQTDFGAADPATPEPSADTMRAATENPRHLPGSSSAGSSTPAGSIEDYFDRLDAAFASMDAPSTPPRRDTFMPPPPPGSGAFGLGDELAQWDPDLSAKDASPEGTGASAAGAGEASPRDEGPTPIDASASTTPVPAGPAQAAAPAPSIPTLAEAFAALLAAEQGRGFAAAPPAHEPLSEDLVEQVTQRVIERLGDHAVRDVVLEVAERLVREEIARLKSSAR